MKCGEDELRKTVEAKQASPQQSGVNLSRRSNRTIH
jgi:hypothetical protein